MSLWYLLAASLAVTSVGACNNLLHAQERRVSGTDDSIPAPVAYETEGIGSIVTCKGFVITWCSGESVEIPEYIDTDDPEWAGLWSRQTSTGETLCQLGGAKPYAIRFNDEKMEFSCTPLTEKREGTPQWIAELVADVSSAAAALDVCRNSDEYASLTAEKALEVHDLRFRADTLVERIGEKYNAELLPVFYYMQAIKRARDQESEAEPIGQGLLCDKELMTEVRNFLVAAEGWTRLPYK